MHRSREILSELAGSRLRNFGQKLFDAPTAKNVVPSPELIRSLSPTLYIHIPFCHAPLCEMCPFFRVEFSAPRAHRYVEDLRSELKKYPDTAFPSVYIGGGTPATVLPELLALVQEFGIGTKELSVEAHPSDLTETNVALMKQAGVTRLSVGIQSFDEGLLAQMGRNNGKNPIEHLRRAAEVCTINADLIYNFAGQTVEQFVADLTTLIALKIPQITCYPLMARPGIFREIDDSHEKRFYDAMLARFKAAGYVPITPWCFTRADLQSQGEYISSSSGEQYLGIGASAISKIGSLFTINTFDLHGYHELAGSAQSAVLGVRELSAAEDAQYFLLTSLFGMRMDLKKLTGNRMKDGLIRSEVLALRALGLVTVRDDVAELTEAGMYFFSTAMKEFYTGLNFFRQRYKDQACGVDTR